VSQFRIYSEQCDYGRRHRVAILIENARGVLAVAEPIAFKTLSDDDRAGGLTFSYDRDFDASGDLDGRALLQAFLDHAWSLGMRPTGVADADTTKQVAAMNAHLQDMRKLVFTGVEVAVEVADRHGGSV
jgi:hypothetical protein